MDRAPPLAIFITFLGNECVVQYIATTSALFNATAL